MVPPASLIRVILPPPSSPAPVILLETLVRVALALAPVISLVARLLRPIEPVPERVAPAAAMITLGEVTEMALALAIAPDRVTVAAPI
jgi:hypothetical protein